jgi:hypothetical protein
LKFAGERNLGDFFFLGGGGTFSCLCYLHLQQREEKIQIEQIGWMVVFKLKTQVN